MLFHGQTYQYTPDNLQVLTEKLNMFTLTSVSLMPTPCCCFKVRPLTFPRVTNFIPLALVSTIEIGKPGFILGACTYKT